MKNSTFKKYKNGYTLLFAVLTAALVLGVAVFITGISRKQFILATTARDSMYALYAADSGIECAASWTDVSSTTDKSFNCNNNPVQIGPFTSDSTGAPKIKGELLTDVKQFPVSSAIPAYIPIPLSTGCANLKYWSGYYNTGSSWVMVIESRGYNICNSDGTPAQSARTVERALRMIKW